MTQVIINDVPPYTQALAILNQTVYGTNWTANFASDVVVYNTPFESQPNDATQILSYPSQYSVAFIGDQLQVQVTLVTPSAAGDIVTITRQTPADRENLYSNTNFTPSMLNNDFGILTLVDQQAQLVDQFIGPRYNYSATINGNMYGGTVDTILPILGENQGWVKNSNNTAIIPYTFPSSGLAPAGDTYVTVLNESATLPNSLGLINVGDGILINDIEGSTLLARSITGTAEQTTVTNGNGLSGNINIAIANNPIIPGTAGIGIPSGTTAQRVIPSGTSINLRYNTTDNAIEYYDLLDDVWVQLMNFDFSDATYIIQTPYSAFDNAQALSTLSTGILKSTTGTGILSISAPLTSIDELSILANDLIYATGSSTYGVISTENSSVLVTSSGGTPSLSQTLPIGVQTNITELGTITTGVWHGTILSPTYGGTGINNGTSTITIGGNLTFSGAHTFTGVLTGATNVTFPTSGTLATTSELSTLPFIVGVNGPYTTIASAITAAHATSPSETSPALVLINPGTYTENLTLEPFVDLSSFNSGAYGSVIINGHATLTSASISDSIAISGITFETNTSNAALTLAGTGSNASIVNISNCSFNGNNGTAIVNTNTNNILNMWSCQLNSGSGQAIFNLSGGFFSIYSTQFSSDNTASQLSNAAVLNLNNCSISDSYVLTTGGTIFMNGCYQNTTGSTNCIALSNDDSCSVYLQSCTLVSNGGTYVISGTGSVVYSDIQTGEGSATALDPGLTLSTFGSLFGGLSLNGGSTVLVGSTGTGSLVGSIAPTFSTYIKVGSSTGPVSLTSGDIQTIGVNAQANIYMASYINNSGDAPTLWSYKSRSTTVGSFSAVQTSDQIGRLEFYGDDGTQFTECANIIVQAVGTISNGIVPGLISFNTANASGSIVSGMTINQSQLTTVKSLLSTTTIVSNQGITSGQSAGGVGSITMYPPTASKGFLEYISANNAGNFSIVNTNASFGQSTTLTIPDPGASTANYILSSGTQTIGNGLTITTPTLTNPNIVGTTTNNNAAAGSVGELISSVVPLASVVSLTNNTSATVTSISLTAGDWDVYGNVTLNGGATTLLQYYSCWCGLSNTTPDPSLWTGQSYGVAGLATFAENQVGSTTPYLRVSIATTTTIYLAVIAGFTLSTATACGGIFARRIR